jgi:hypothetical protein
MPRTSVVLTRTEVLAASGLHVDKPRHGPGAARARRIRRTGWGCHCPVTVPGTVQFFPCQVRKYNMRSDDWHENNNHAIAIAIHYTARDNPNTLQTPTYTELLQFGLEAHCNQVQPVSKSTASQVSTPQYQSSISEHSSLTYIPPSQPATQSQGRQRRSNPRSSPGPPRPRCLQARP